MRRGGRGAAAALAGVAASLAIAAPAAPAADDFRLAGPRSTSGAGRRWSAARPPAAHPTAPPRSSPAWRAAHLVIDLHARRASLTRRGRTVFRTRVGIGKPKTPTPRGQFMVRNRITGFTDPLHGALAFGTTARSATLTDWPGGGFIGIHGTDLPEQIPGRISHGCVRLRNRAILRLDRRMPVGTPVTIR